MATKSISQYNGISAYNLQLNGTDTREINGFYSPNAIVQNSLIYSYDPANPDSYDGTGTTLFDLKSSNNLTLNGGVESSYNQAGFFEFDKVNDVILNGGGSFPSNDFSMGMWVKTPANFNGIQAIGGVVNNQFNGWVIYTNSVNLVFRATDGSNLRVLIFPFSTYPLATDTWYYLGYSWLNTSALINAYIYDSTGLLYSQASATGGSFNISGNYNNLITIIGSNVYYSDYGYGEVHFYQTNMPQSTYDRNYDNTKARYGY